MRTAVGLLVFVSIGAGQQPLSVVESAVSDTLNGGQVPDTYEFAPGDIVHVSFQVSGYRLSERGRIELSYMIEAVDCMGNPFEPPHEERLAQAMPVSRTVTRPIRFSVVLPDAPWPGDARFRISVTDVLAGETTHAELPFGVGGIPLDISSGFRVGGLGLYRSEESQERLSDPVFHAGDTVWARFQLAGFERGEKNRFSLGYNVKLIDPRGRVVLSVPQAATETKEPYYPRWQVPGFVSVRLESTIRPGLYSLIIEALDEIGKGSARGEIALRVP